MALTAVCRSLKLFQISHFLTQTRLENVRKTTLILQASKENYSTEKKAWITGKSGSPFEPQHPKERISKTSPEIVLITDERVSSITLEHAEKLAKRRNLRLVKIVDFNVKSSKPTYKLMTTAEFFEEDVKAKHQRAKDRLTDLKDEKLITMTTKIAEHDLHSKIHQMGKLLKKRHPVRVLITHEGNKERGVEMMKTIETAVKNVATFTQQSSKQSSSKVTITPIIQTEAIADNETEIKEENNTTNVKTEAKPTNIEERSEGPPAASQN